MPNNKLLPASVGRGGGYYEKRRVSTHHAKVSVCKLFERSANSHRICVNPLSYLIKAISAKQAKMYGLLLLLHILAATIWTGGHIVLSVVVLPQVLKDQNPEALLRFESVYEKIGMPALIIQILTGLILAHRMVPDFTQWFNTSNPASHAILAKLVLLALTVGFAIDARFRVIPTLSASTLKVMAWHIVSVSFFSILFVVVGVSFRTGWLY
jgi:putative copper export protein